MKLFNHVVTIGIITVAALLYVHQQIELVKLSYEIDCRDKQVKELLDRREILRYNISNLEAPSRLENVLSLRKVPVSYPKRGQVILLSKAPAQSRIAPFLSVPAFEERMPALKLFDFLLGRAEAHAREK